MMKNLNSFGSKNCEEKSFSCFYNLLDIMKLLKIANYLHKLAAAYPMNMGVEEFFKFWRDASQFNK